METDTERLSFDHGPLADLEERKVVFSALDSLRQYRKNCHYNTTHRRRQNFYALPQKHRDILISQPFNILDTFNAVDDAIDHNADIADAILYHGLQNFGLPQNPNPGSDLFWHGNAKAGDMAKAHSTIRQLYRDWSADGFENEVQPILSKILVDLESLDRLPTTQKKPRILLPGAGLGRLLFELALMGYNVEGNEISYHQLLASNFILNGTELVEQYKLYPFATTFTNHLRRSHQLKEVKIPDIHPGAAFAGRMQEVAEGSGVLGEMNMTAGDFLTSYSDFGSQETFEVVLTVFFIDTAPNLVRYIETIRHCLIVNGIWINFGPLLWHFDDRKMSKADEDGKEADDTVSPDVEDAGIGELGSFELSDDEVITLVERMGFEIIKHENLPESFGGYIQDPHSMVQNRYRCSHWSARKK